MHPVSADEIRRLADEHGTLVERCVVDQDHLGRPDLRWTRMALRLPDDGSGALEASSRAARRTPRGRPARFNQAHRRCAPSRLTVTAQAQLWVRRGLRPR